MLKSDVVVAAVLWVSVFKMCLWQGLWARQIRQQRFELTIVTREILGPRRGLGIGTVILFSVTVISYQSAGGQAGQLACVSRGIYTPALGLRLWRMVVCQ